MSTALEGREVLPETEIEEPVGTVRTGAMKGPPMARSPLVILRIPLEKEMFPGPMRVAVVRSPPAKVRVVLALMEVEPVVERVWVVSVGAATTGPVVAEPWRLMDVGETTTLSLVVREPARRESFPPLLKATSGMTAVPPSMV